MKICMIGSGYVGLVSGACFAELGNNVICLDKNLNKISNLKNGVIPIYEPGLEELIQRNVKQKRLQFSTNISKSIIKSDIIFICVGTPTKIKSNEADLKYIFQVVKDLKKNCSKDMIKIHKKYKASVMASMTVSKNNVNRWGIYSSSKKLNNQNFIISDVIEKPSTKEAPSNNAVIGRYILNKDIFKILKKQKKGKGGEIHITDSIKTMIDNKSLFIGHKFSGKYLDCGSMSGYIKSTLEISKL